MFPLSPTLLFLFSLLLRFFFLWFSPRIFQKSEKKRSDVVNTYFFFFFSPARRCVSLRGTTARFFFSFSFSLSLYNRHLISCCLFICFSSSALKVSSVSFSLARWLFLCPNLFITFIYCVLSFRCLVLLGFFQCELGTLTHLSFFSPLSHPFPLPSPFFFF